MKNKRQIIFSILLFLVNSIVAQVAHRLVVQTHVFNDAVAIRWTPGDLNLWREWSHNGYQLERYTIARNGKQILDGESVLITGKAILPYDDSIVADLQDARLITSCLFPDEPVNSKSDMLQQIEEDNNCYIFSMLCIQRNFKLAMVSGLGIIDNTTHRSETYMYKLYPVGSSSTDTQMFVVDAGRETEMPVIADVSATLSGEKVMLQWNAPQSNDYYAYRIERSVDSGLNYHQVDTTFLLQREASVQVFSDTIKLFNQPVYYRVRGVNYFGLLSNVSQPVSIIVYPFTHAYPQFLESFFDSGVTSIHWVFDSLECNKINGFMLYQSDSIMGEFIQVDSILLPSTSKSIVIPKTLSDTKYFKVGAITKNNIVLYSHPLLVQQVDSFPPDIPDFTNCMIDSNGLVVLNWRPSKALDLISYRIYKGNIRFQEFALISPHYFKDTFFYDTISTTMLNDSIYYTITAVDNRYNESEQSKVCALMTNNNIEPDIPVIYQVISDFNIIELHWFKSNNSRVAKYILKRNCMSTAERMLVDISFLDSQFKDTAIVGGETYAYTIEAVSKNGTYSGSANPVIVKAKKQLLMPVVTVNSVVNDSAKRNLSIFWDYQFDSEVSHYKIMEIKDNATYNTIGTAKGGQLFFNYHYHSIHRARRYVVIAYFKDGRRSQL